MDLRELKIYCWKIQFNEKNVNRRWKAVVKCLTSFVFSSFFLECYEKRKKYILSSDFEGFTCCFCVLFIRKSSIQKDIFYLLQEFLKYYIHIYYTSWKMKKEECFNQKQNHQKGFFKSSSRRIENDGLTFVFLGMKHKVYVHLNWNKIVIIMWRVSIKLHSST